MTPSKEVVEFWKRFTNSEAGNKISSQSPCQAWSFGDSKHMANDLALLVVSGRKTATASLHWVYAFFNEAIPKVGEFNIILNGDEIPMCITKTKEINIIAYDQVGEKFAFDEGEGDQSLEYWRKVHWEFFARECKTMGREPEKNMPIVCEQFILVYTPEM